MMDSSDQTDDSISVIEPSGDMYLHIKEEAHDLIHQFRVSSVKLRQVSEYFQNLLDPAKFQEGMQVAERLNSLQKNQPPGLDTIDQRDLPVISIIDIPNPSSSSVKSVVECFLDVVHETSIEGRAAKFSSRKVPMSFITRLAIVADRFLALQAIKPFVDAYHKTQQPAKETFRLVYSLQNEHYWRQRLLVGVWLGYPNWVSNYSRLLIQHGSEYWARLELGENEISPTSTALWTHIPWGVEDEMMHRRSCMLSTISSLQDFFLDRYASGKRQCKLGYDSSPQCDSFQLGEMVRFFSKKKLLTLQSSINGQDWKPSYGGNLLELLKSLRQCPAYQVNPNHAHCGIRTLLVPRVEFLESWISDPLHSGICLKCWHGEKNLHSWIGSPPKGRWQWSQRSKMTFPALEF